MQPSAPPSAILSTCQVSFPVVIEDGRRLEIQWHLGDDPIQVASSFARRHSIPSEEISTIAQFVADATRMTQEQSLKEDPQTKLAECTQLVESQTPEAIALKKARAKLGELGLGYMDPEVLRVMMEDAHYDVESLIVVLTQ